MYIIPSNDISKNILPEDGKIAISNQHRNSKEGHLTLEKLNKYLKFEINCRVEEILKKNLEDYI